MDTKKVTTLLEEALAVNDELFVIDFSISTAGDIEVVVDGDRGVSLDECIRISRHIEHNLDREVDDFSLKVSSPDITKPLVKARQYKKNKGRVLSIQTQDAIYEGTLLDVGESNIVLQWKTREPKPIGKGKHTVTKEASIALDDITKAVVKIVYN